MRNLKFFAKRTLETLGLSQQYNVGQSTVHSERGRFGEGSITKLKNSFQLISLHIPKSGGTSFYKTLQGVYGKKTLARVDYKPHLKKILINEHVFEKDAFPDELKIIHGHFQYNALLKYVELNEDVKIITWLRNPVERVISDYFFVRNIVNDRYRHDPYNPHVLNRMSKTLLEFAAQDIERNRISRFLGEVKIEDFFFVGVLEYFVEDLERLSELLNWKSYTKAELNKTKNKPKEIAGEIIEKIMEFNSKDMDLYEKALVLRQGR